MSKGYIDTLEKQNIELARKVKEQAKKIDELVQKVNDLLNRRENGKLK